MKERSSSSVDSAACPSPLLLRSGFNTSSSLSLGRAPSAAKVRRAMSFTTSVCVYVCVMWGRGGVEARGYGHVCKGKHKPRYVCVCVCVFVAVVTVTDSNNGNGSGL